MQPHDTSLLLATAKGVLVLLSHVDGTRAADARAELADAIDDAEAARSEAQS